MPMDWTRTANRWTTLYTAAMQRPTKQHRRKPRGRTNRRTATTLKEVYNSMTPEQKECCHALVGMALEKRDGEETNDEEEETVKQNVFEKDTRAPC